LADGFGQLLQELEAGQRPHRCDVSYRISFYKRFWEQRNLLAVRDVVLDRQMKSADGNNKTSRSHFLGKAKECWQK
jgi:hypothetical protein